MAHYIFREKTTSESIAPDAKVTFNLGRALSDHHVKTLDPPSPFTTDYFYNEDGIIDICVPGAHIIIWVISQMTARSPAGSFFQLKVFDKATGVWKPLSPIDAALKISAASASACIMVYPGNTALPGGYALGPERKVSFALFNTSGQTLDMNRMKFLKAALVSFGSGTLGPLYPGQLDVLNARLDDLKTNHGDLIGVEFQRNRAAVIEGEDDIQNEQLAVLEKSLNEAISYFISMSSPSGVTNLPSMDVPGLGVSVLHTGFMHNFWSYGSPIRTITYEADADVYLAMVSSYPILAQFIGPVVTGICYYESRLGRGWTPVYFDETGIYLKVKRGYVFEAGSIYRFTKALILQPDDEDLLSVENNEGMGG